MAQQHHDALSLAQTYFARWDAGDLEGLRAILDENVTIVLPMSGGDSPEPSTVFSGVDSSLGYLQFSSDLFDGIRLTRQEWSVSNDARYVHLHARGDMRTKTGTPYTNVYVCRLELRDGVVVHVDECTNPTIWTNLGIS